jgi:hypothetical protein
MSLCEHFMRNKPSSICFLFSKHSPIHQTVILGFSLTSVEQQYDGGVYVSGSMHLTCIVLVNVRLRSWHIGNLLFFPQDTCMLTHQVKNACTCFLQKFQFFKGQIFTDCPDSVNSPSTQYSLAKSNFISGSEACKGPRKPKTHPGTVFLVC